MTTRSVPRLVVPSTTAVMTLAEAKGHLRVDYADEDALIGIYLDAAIDGLTGPQGWLSRSLIDQGYAFDLDNFPCGDIALPLGGLSAVTGVQYVDALGQTQTLPTSVYKLVTDNAFDARLVLKVGQTWPVTAREEASVTITFTSGFGPDATKVPSRIKLAILLMTADMYRNREIDRANYDTRAYDNLLSGYRKVTL